MKTKFNGILTLLLAFVVQISFAQGKTISGTISDGDNSPLPGVNVLVKGTSNGTITDFDGNYSISAKTGDILVFSYVTSTVEKTVGSESNISFVMSDNTLEEVVITALGIKRKRDEITSVYQEVKTEELVKANNPSVINSLTGKVSGLTITQNSNGVSGNSRIVLRGNRSISGNNEALIVIDGAVSTTGILNAIDPNQIDTVNIIKGAAGSALYGSLGSNGVIVVKTKTTTKGEKMIVQFNSSVDFESVAYVPEKQTRYGQGWTVGNGFENITYENGGWGPEFDGEVVPVGLPQSDGTFITAPYESRGSDHLKEFFKTGITRQNSISVSSGGPNEYFSLSARNVDTEFIIRQDERKRNTLTLRAGKTLGNWTAAGNVIYTNTTVERTNGNLYDNLLQSATNIPIEQFANSGNEGHWNAFFRNPYWDLENQRTRGENNNISLQGELGYKVDDNISFKLLSNARIFEGNSLSYQNAYTESDYVSNFTGADRSVISNFAFQNFRSSTYYTDFFVNLDYDLNEEVSFGGNIGLNNRYVKSSSTQVGGQDLTVPGIFTTNNLNGGVDDAFSGDTRSQSSTISAFANLDFGYKDFLFLTLTGRNDWLSTLDVSNQSFFYPSASVSFLPTKAFNNIKSDVLNYLKITAAYVETGNASQVAPFATQQLVNQGAGFPFGGQNSFVVDTNITDPLIQPEFTQTIEFGINFGLLKNRITLDLSYANFTGSDQITNINTSSTTGLSTSRLNIAETEGSSFEVDLGLKVIKTDNIKWDVNLGYSTSSNEVLSVTDQSDEVSLGGFTGFAESFAIKGEQFPVLQTNFYERDPQGRVLIDPSSGNPIEASGLKIAGRTTPEHIVNLNTSFSYKNWSLRATMDYRTGHVFYSDTKSNLTWSGHAVETAEGGRGAFIFPNSAIETSPGVFQANTNVPSAAGGAGDFINFFGLYRGVGENHILDATAFKVRELSLSYDLNKEYLKDIFISSLRISATARNPFTVLPEENRGYNDPESNFTGGNAQGITTTGNNPPTRTFGIGLNLTF